MQFIPSVVTLILGVFTLYFSFLRVFLVLIFLRQEVCGCFKLRLLHVCHVDQWIIFADSDLHHQTNQEPEQLPRRGEMER